MQRFNKVSFAPLLSMLVLATACASSDDATPDQLGKDAAKLVSDAAHNQGTPGFYFLPPIVADAPDEFTGEFESRLRPTVRIDRIDAVTGQILRTVATMEADSAHHEYGPAHGRARYYAARWDTARNSLDAAHRYRIRVLLGAKELGFADVHMLTGGHVERPIVAHHLPAIRKGMVLAIKFRIERQAVDQDGDGVFDWRDNCATVANPPEPRRHGRSHPFQRQLDSDGDGTGDACECLDVTCTAADVCHEAGVCDATTGTCSAGAPLPDSDGDGSCDGQDQCPADPGKIEPGTCGCGVVESAADTDGDGTADCVDECPTDAAKTLPGGCGCGVADSDSDGDGALDCVDGCPTNPGKTEQGVCGCFQPDIDTDGDATPDCLDQCDYDPAKIAPQTCGCNVPESSSDGDGDGSLDCVDYCPADPSRNLATLCSCETPSSDPDGAMTCADGSWLRIFDQADRPDIGSGVAVDAAGNVYFGWTSHLRFADYVYLVKVTPAGEVTMNAGVPVHGELRAITTEGNTLARTGYENGPGGVDVILHYYPDGVWAWQKWFGTPQADYGMDVALDEVLDVYVTGYTSGAFDGYTNAGGEDAFLAKYLPDGTASWVIQLGTGGNDRGLDMATDRRGGVYIAGYTSGALDDQVSAGYVDAFVTKYAPDGTRQWTRQIGTPGYDTATGIGTDSAGNVYVSGYTYGSVDDQPYAGSADLFLIKLDADGQRSWTRQLGTADGDTSSDLAVDQGDIVYVTAGSAGILGDFRGSAVLRFDAAGNQLSSRQLPFGSQDVAVDESAVYLGGTYYNASIEARLVKVARSSFVP